MNIVKESVVSGSTQVAGFKVDGDFIATQPINSYLCWEFQGTDEVSFPSFRLDSPGFEIELVSLLTAKVANQPAFPEVEVDSITCELQKIAVNTVDTILVFKQSNLGLAPIEFAPGLVAPPNSRLTITLSDNARFIRLIAKPVFCQTVGALTPSV